MFGSLDERVLLGFVGASAVLDKSKQDEFQTKTEKYLRNEAMTGFHLAMHSLQVKVVKSIMVPITTKYRSSLLDHVNGDRAALEKGSSVLLLFSEITADTLTLNVENDEVYNSSDRLSLNSIFRGKWDL